MNLNKLGWHAFFEAHLESFRYANASIGRICSEHKSSYKLFSEHGELNAIISGKFRNACKEQEDFPVVGDWVLFDLIKNENKAIIQSILPRRSKFSRRAAGKETKEQVLAANIDTTFIVCALNYDFNLRRIERYLSMVWQSGANPVIILTKPDLCANSACKLSEVQEIAFGVDIHLVDNLSKSGIDALLPYCIQGRTIVLLGSSGAGKSSLINNLLGDNKMQVKELRKNIDKGQHTTTHRQMFVLPLGGLVIDNPGLRELQLWDVDDGISNCFNEIEFIAENCRFNDCKHQGEPGCAVRKAIEDGILDAKRLENYLKMLKEQEYISSCQTQSAAQIERKKWKGIHKQIKQLYKEK